ncbi:hypothetical protein FPRO04_13203 [Fusarium proliferatum]|nr:hypothetical protein FPRO04_13203 [Fusarium proliferatum]
MWISGRFNDAERRYTLAVVRGLSESDWMINHSPHPVKAYTDHKGITDSMANRGHLHGKISRWIEILWEHDIEYGYRSCTDKVMRLADGMSRLPEAQKEDAKPVELRLGIKRVLGVAPPTELSANTILPGGRPPGKRLIARSEKLEIGHWEHESWYSEILSTLLKGLSSVEEGRRRLMKRRVLRYRIFDDALHYLENDESWALCATESEVPIILQNAHDRCGHFAVAITSERLRGRHWWPSRASDTENTAGRAWCANRQRPVFQHHSQGHRDIPGDGDAGMGSRELNLALVDAREELQENVQNRANNLTQPAVPRTHKRLRVGTVVWEKQDKAGTLKTKFHRSLGNLSRVAEQVSEVTYMTTSLVAPGKTRRVHVDDLKPYVRRLARLEPPKVIELELGADKEDQRQMLEDPTWDNPEIVDPYANL